MRKRRKKVKKRNLWCGVNEMNVKCSVTCLKEEMGFWSMGDHWTEERREEPKKDRKVRTGQNRW